MNQTRWNYLKQLNPHQRYVHTSKDVAMLLPDPRGPGYPAVPWVGKGVTLHKGETRRSLLRWARRKGVISARQQRIAIKDSRRARKDAI